MKKIIITFVIFVVGCSSSNIVKLSPDTYMLTKEDHGGIFAFNRGAMKTDAIREANAFAENQGKIAIPVSTHEHPVGILGDWASFEYQFQVVDKNDPDARRTSLVPRPDIVIDKTEKIFADVQTKDQSKKPKDMYAELIKLDDLRKKGILSDEEFDAQKKMLLN
ncbi:MAG: SHOCT domain-containing protein [Methylococcaceae bacterium]